MFHIGLIVPILLCLSGKFAHAAPDVSVDITRSYGELLTQLGVPSSVDNPVAYMTYRAIEGLEQDFKAELGRAVRVGRLNYDKYLNRINDITENIYRTQCESLLTALERSEDALSRRRRYEAENTYITRDEFTYLNEYSKEEWDEDGPYHGDGHEIIYGHKIVGTAGNGDLIVRQTIVGEPYLYRPPLESIDYYEPRVKQARWNLDRYRSGYDSEKTMGVAGLARSIFKRRIRRTLLDFTASMLKNYRGNTATDLPVIESCLESLVNDFDIGHPYSDLDYKNKVNDALFLTTQMGVRPVNGGTPELLGAVREARSLDRYNLALMEAHRVPFVGTRGGQDFVTSYIEGRPMRSQSGTYYVSSVYYSHNAQGLRVSLYNVEKSIVFGHEPPSELLDVQDPYILQSTAELQFPNDLAKPPFLFALQLHGRRKAMLRMLLDGYLSAQPLNLRDIFDAPGQSVQTVKVTGMYWDPDDQLQVRLRQSRGGTEITMPFDRLCQVMWGRVYEITPN